MNDRASHVIAISTLSNDEDLPLMLEIIWPILNLLETP